MKVNIDIELIPFNIPDIVHIKVDPKPRQEGFRPSNGIMLSDLDADTLDRLCEEFTNGVFKKANKQRPLSQP